MQLGAPTLFLTALLGANVIKSRFSFEPRRDQFGDDLGFHGGSKVGLPSGSGSGLGSGSGSGSVVITESFFHKDDFIVGHEEEIFFQKLGNGGLMIEADPHMIEKKFGSSLSINLNCRNTTYGTLLRNYDGQCNNVTNPAWGSASTRQPEGDIAPGGGNVSHHCGGCYSQNRWATHGGSNNNGAISWNYSPRVVSNKASAWSTNNYTSTDPWRADATITYAQYMDHDFDLTGSASAGYGTSGSTGGAFPIKHTASNDHHASPVGFTRSGGMFVSNRHTITNGITSYIDAGCVYGQSDARANALLKSNGYLRYSQLAGPASDTQYTRHYLPTSKEMGCRTNGGNICDLNSNEGIGMANPTGRGCFYAGDVRANENPALVAFHTIFLRYSNKLSASGLTKDAVRHQVGYVTQNITFNEWLPAFFGQFRDRVQISGGVLISNWTTDPPLRSFNYNSSRPADVHNIFSTGTFRVHTGVSPVMKQATTGGDLQLDQTFFEGCVWFGNVGPGCTSLTGAAQDDLDTNGVYSLGTITVGQFIQSARLAGPIMLTEQRNQLFYKAIGPTAPSVTLSTMGGSMATADQNYISGVGQDLTSWNIARGRDHGIKAYADVVIGYFGSNQAGCRSPISSMLYALTGASPPSASCAFNSNGASPYVAGYGVSNQQQAYANIDVWIAALAEAKVHNGVAPSGSCLGPTLTADYIIQHEDARDGDRFYYKNCNGAGNGPEAWCNERDVETQNFATVIQAVTAGTSSLTGTSTKQGCGGSNCSVFRRQKYAKYKNGNQLKKNYNMWGGCKPGQKDKCGPHEC